MKALLARPHDFVVQDMTSWLTELGVTPVRLTALADLDAHPAAEVKAVVISTAVSSPVKASFDEVLAHARRRFPSAALLFAGLSKVASVRVGVAAALAANGLLLAGIDEAAAWGTSGVALYVQDTDFRGGRRAALTAAAKKHLRLDRAG